MSTKSKQILIFAAIVLVLALAAAVILFGRDDGGNYEKELAEAEKYVDACDYDNAVAIYNRVISENYECAEAYAGLADSYFAKERSDKALEILQKGAENTDNSKIILDKMDELFPDLNYVESSDESEETSEKTVSETYESEVTESETTSEISESITTETDSAAFSETVSETTEPESEAITVPTTASTTVPTTVWTTITTAPPATTSTAAPTTVPTTIATTSSAETKELLFVEVPDFTLMTIDEAYSWCSKNNLYLKVIGSGEKPLSQSPAPGTSVEENSDIIVKCGE